jgi:UDP-N-acetylmuramoyl-tripeptide--D-alanyl-D-alanine ligase
MNQNQLDTQQSIHIDISEDTRSKLIDAQVIAFGTQDYCGYRAIDIQMVNGETHFTLKTAITQDDGEEIVLQVLGEHNIYNALAALAVAGHYGIPASVAKKGLFQYQPIAMRGQIKEVNQVKIIDDSYNASPDSMKGGIQVLLQLEGVKRRIAVLADVLELGEQSYQCHYDVGIYIAACNIDEVVTIGTEAAYIAEAIQEQNPAIQTRNFLHNADAITYLKEALKPGDAVLIKGSRSMKTDEIVKAFTGEGKA